MMSCEWLVLGLALVMGCVQHVDSGSCPMKWTYEPPATGSITDKNPGDICVDVDVCTNLNITVTGSVCLPGDRITLFFYIDQDTVNPQLDAQFGYGGKYRYQANNHAATGWGKEQIFEKIPKLGPFNTFKMEILIRGHEQIMWFVNEEYIGMYRMRDGAKVMDIKKLCIKGCAVVDSVEFSKFF